MGQFPSPELDCDLDAIAVLQELDCPPYLRVEIADADLRLEPDFLEGNRALLSLGFLLAFGQLVLVLTEVEEARHRRTGQRCNLYQVEPPLLRKPQGVGRSHDTELATVFIDDPNVEHADHLIDAQVSANGESLLCDPVAGYSEF